VNGIEKASKSWPSMIHPHICLRAQVCASVVVVIVIDKLSLCERHYPSMLLREGEEWGGGWGTYPRRRAEYYKKTQKKVCRLSSEKGFITHRLTPRTSFFAFLFACQSA